MAIGEVLPADEATSSIITQAFSGIANSSQGTCRGTFSGGLCNGYWDKNITFDSPFSAIPQMFVSPAETSAQG